jgi:hypothetical protein
MPKSTPFLRVLAVTTRVAESGGLRGGSIDSPTPAASADVPAMRVEGWAIARDVPAVRVQVCHRDRVLREAPLDIPRPKAVEQAGVDEQTRPGFSLPVSLLALPPTCELSVNITLSDGRAVPLGSITVEHSPIRPSRKPVLQPLLVTSLGRTGTTWLMRLLAEHPRVVAHRRYPYETRAAGYWLHMLQLASQPAHDEDLDSFLSSSSHLGPNPAYGARTSQDVRLTRWFQRTYPLHLATFCQEAADSFYEQVALEQGETAPQYFAEKTLPDHIPVLAAEVWSASRELILVRDPRDVLCSILAFNERRGFTAFGREQVESDLEFIPLLCRDMEQLLWHARSRSAAAQLVRYEDLLVQPEVELTEILGYLGADASPDTIAGMLERASEESAHLTKHRTSADAKASIGRWRRDLSPELIDCANQSFAQVLEELGYRTEAADDSGPLALVEARR